MIWKLPIILTFTALGARLGKIKMEIQFVKQETSEAYTASATLFMRTEPI